MKTNRLIAIMMLAAALCASPVYAQRGGGGSHGGGSRSGGGYSSSSSRGGGGFSSSSSRGGGSYSSGSSFSSSRSSSSSTSSRSTYNATPSRSSSSSRSTVSSSMPNRGSSVRGTSSKSESSYRGSRSSSTVGSPSSSAPSRVDRSSATTSGSAVSRDHKAPQRGGNVRTDNGSSVRGGGQPVKTDGRHATGTAGRGEVYPQNSPAHSYARPGRPGPMPPSIRPMRPAPYFHHPYLGCMVHMHPIFWDPLLPLRPIFWPGFWVYCNSYWYDYHVTDVVVVNRYVKDTYNVDMVSYAVSGDILYAIVNDSDGNTYLQVFDKNDKLLAEQEISSKYIKTEIDRENGGCWIFKKHDKDPMLFLFVDGELLIYEAD